MYLEALWELGDAVVAAVSPMANCCLYQQFREREQMVFWREGKESSIYGTHDIVALLRE